MGGDPFSNESAYLKVIVVVVKQPSVLYKVVSEVAVWLCVMNIPGKCCMVGAQ
jgi:hypothetical protein